MFGLQAKIFTETSKLPNTKNDDQVFQEKRKEGIYYIKKGMTLYKLAKAFGVDVEFLKIELGLKDLKASQELEVFKTISCNKREGLYSLAKRAHCRSLEEFCELNGINKNYTPQENEVFFCKFEKNNTSSTTTTTTTTTTTQQQTNNVKSKPQTPLSNNSNTNYKKEYTMTNKETIADVAEKFNMSIDALYELNPKLKEQSNLKKLTVPTITFDGDWDKLQAITGMTKEEIYDLNGIKQEFYNFEEGDVLFVKKIYFNYTPAQKYTVENNDNCHKIARKHNIQSNTLIAFNTKQNKQFNAEVIRRGETLTIPEHKEIKPDTIKSLEDVAKALKLDEKFLENLKDIEKMRLTIYKDKGGVETIGIGHALQTKEKKDDFIKEYFDPDIKGNSLTEAQTYELLAKDLLIAEEELKALFDVNYNNFPQALKQALIDMVFNKGINIIKKDKNLYRNLCNKQYEKAITCMTNIKSEETKEEMSGLAKRRLFNIATAAQIIEKTNPITESMKSIQNTVTELYNKGIELLKKEYPDKYNNLIGDYKTTVEGYFKGIDWITIPEIQPEP